MVVLERIFDALEASCIKESRTTKPEGAEEWSWREKLYPVGNTLNPDGINIFPSLLHQGQRSLCLFLALTFAAQMELNVEMAKEGEVCNIRFLWESLLTRFLELHGFRQEEGEEERKKMEFKLITQEESSYVWEDAVPWCFKYLGVNAEIFHHASKDTMVHDPALGNSSGMKVSALDVCRRFSNPMDDDLKESVDRWSQANKKTVANLGISDYKRYEGLSQKQVWDHVEKGKAVVAGILIGDEFLYLEADEIYAWLPTFDETAKKWTDKPGGHAVVLVGNGNAGPEMEHEQYHPFANTHGSLFGDRGCGSVFYKGLLDRYIVLEMDAHPEQVTKTMSELKGIPLPQQRPVEVKAPLPTPAPLDMPPPRRNQPPSSAALYVPPARRNQPPSSAALYVPPAPRNLPHGGRAAIDKARW